MDGTCSTIGLKCILVGRSWGNRPWKTWV